MMDQPALQLLIDTSRKILPPVCVETEEPDHVYWLYNPLTGSLEKHTADTAPRAHTALSLKSFCEFVVLHKDGGPINWVGEHSAVAVLDDDDSRRNRLTWTLPYSARWTHLTQSVLGKSFDQIEFARLLRVKLRGMVPASLVPIVQSLKLEQGRVMQGEAERFKDSSSLATRREVSGVDKFPESFNVTCPILQGDESAEIECTIEVSLDTGKLSIIAYPDEVESALIDRLNTLAKQIDTDTSCPTFLGTP